MLSSIAMKKQTKKSLVLATETVRTLRHVALERVFAGFGTGTSKDNHGNTCCGCQDTTGGHDQE
jgi:hypothetical protein